jgi:hypothetical protein
MGKHGMTGTRVYRSWWDMKHRCNNVDNRHYKDYGGRGITYCAEWEDFINFYNDMGDMPEGLSLDRIDNNQGYCKENCRWATPKEQASNRRLPAERSDNTTGVIGVYRNKHGWEVQYCGKYIGFSKDFDEAVRMRKEAESI